MNFLLVFFIFSPTYLFRDSLLDLHNLCKPPYLCTDCQGSENATPRPPHAYTDHPRAGKRLD
jgi:hypothetical protein